MLGLSSEGPVEDRPTWAVRAAHVLLGGVAREEFVRFMHTFGGDAGPGRTSFPTLVEALTALENTELPSLKRLEQIGFLFPDPGRALRLKRALLGQPRPLMRDMPALDTLFAVYELADPTPYSGSAVADGKRLLALWENHPRERTLILSRWVNHDWNQLGESAFDEVCMGVPVTAIADALADAGEPVVRATIEKRPGVVASPRFWELPEDAIAVGIEAAAAAQTPREVWRGVLLASEFSMRQNVWKRLPPASVEPLARAILDTLEDQTNQLPAAADIVLPEHAKLVWSWMDNLAEPIERAALLLTRYVEVADAALIVGDSARRLAHRAADASRDFRAADTVAAVLLGIALSRRWGNARSLIEVCFDRVHTALRAGTLDAAGHAALKHSLFPRGEDVSADALTRRLVQRYEAEQWGWTDLVGAVAGGSVVDHLLRLFAPPSHQSDRKR
jgi:hypothetical protein